MSERGSQEGADVHIRNEAANAVTVLLRLLGKYGLSLGDIPELQRQHAAKTKAKATAAPAAGTAQGAGPNVLDLIRHMLQSYIDMQPHEYVGTVLWILHTHVFTQFQVTPRLALLSPVRGCGKSKLLLLIEKLAANPERHDSITAAAFIRVIERACPTLLLDEGDNLGLKLDRVIRSVLNSGYLRGGQRTLTVRGRDRSFSTFAPAAIGAIGTLPLPLLQRSIVIQMQRSERDDLKTIEDMRTDNELKRFGALHQHMAAWAADVIKQQFNPDPSLPKILRHRARDNWRVLISIADSFGSAHWSELARNAATTFADGYYDEDACVALLHDIRSIFRREGVDRIKSAILVAMLHELEEGMGIWSAWRGEADDQNPHPITQGGVATLLRRFHRNLRPKKMFELGSRKTRGKSGRGYFKEQFTDWWKKYCPEGTDEGTADNVVNYVPKSKA